MQAEIVVRKKVRPEWADVQRGLVLVDLTIARWRGRVKADWDNLGLPAKVFEQAFTPGAQRLLPVRIQQELDQIEQMTREALNRVGFRTLFGILVPKERYFTFKQRMEMPLADLRRALYGRGVPDYAPKEIWESTSAIDRWYQLAQEIAQNREYLVAEVASMYDAALENVWRRQQNISSEATLTQDQIISMQTWMDGKKTAIIALIPSSDELLSSFTLSWTVSDVETPPEVLKAMKMEEIQRQEQELERKLAEADSEIKRLDILRQQEQLRIERAIAEEIARTREGATKRFEQAINQIIGQLHGEIYELVLDQLEYLRDNGALHSRNVGRIKGLVELIRGKLSGLTDETTLERACRELEALANSGTATREDAASQVRMKLLEVGAMIKADLVAAGVPSRSGRDLGIADEPVVLAERQERNLLNIDLPEIDITDLSRAERFSQVVVEAD